jgi:CHAT domain-containing protein/tetratricopeptide (TPR) repeat protein
MPNEPAPPKESPEGQLQRRIAQLNGQANRLYQEGRYTAAIKLLREALGLYERLYPKEKYPHGHPELAIGLHNLGLLLENRRDYDGALTYLGRAVEIFERFYPRDKYPRGHPNLETSLASMGLLLVYRGDYDRAFGYLRRALRMCQRLYPEAKYPDGHPDLADRLSNLALVLTQQGAYPGALAYYRQALGIYERLYPPDKYPRGHPYLALALNNVAQLLTLRGDYGTAVEYSRRSLEMHARLYPNDKYPHGHPSLAVSLKGLADVLYLHRDYAAALRYSRRALKMNERLYPPDKYPGGHPAVVNSLHSLARMQKDRGDYQGAQGYTRRALAMDERLYPRDKYPLGHADLADSLNRLGLLLKDRGDFAGALACNQRALTMCEQLYPESKYPGGHPLLAGSLLELGAVLKAQGNYAGALRSIKKALAMYDRLAELFAGASAEAQALTYAASLPLTRDALLSTARHLPGTDADAYAAVWASKAAITRCIERRRRGLAQALASQQLAASRRQEAERMWEKLLDTRRALARLLLSAPGHFGDHRRRADQLSREKEDLEGQLARLLPTFARERDQERLRPAALVEKLPPATVFIDLVQYVNFDQDPQRPGKKGEKQTPSYAAFVLRRGAPIRRVELGPAGPIDQTLAAWRSDIRDEKAGPAAQALRALLWQPLAKHVPSGTRAVLLAPDAALTRLPWPALPVSQVGRVLLEDCAVAVVPHAPFLLERLSEPARASKDDGLLLAVGAVNYDGKPPMAPARQDVALLRSADLGTRQVVWPALAGTARELDQVIGRAGKRAVRRLSGAEASTSRLWAELPRARWVHLATHGFFADAKFRSALQVDEKLFAAHGFRGGAPPGTRNPLVLAGLVLAGANLPLAKDLGRRLADDGGILTAEAVVGLPLDNLELAVCSACETGLGEVAGGEGVFGLQRAFHLAGCKNVVASLWKVDDQATAALMALFYDKMWRQNKPPFEALREAQLTLYHHPERIGVLAQERGPNFDKVVRLPAAPDKGVKTQPGGKAPTKLWAGFVLSGLGR